MQKYNLFIALFELIGGVLGFGITTYVAVYVLPNLFIAENLLINKIIVLCILLYALVAYALIAIAGYVLYKKKKNGVKLSLIAQAIQIPNIAIAGFSYFFTAGAHVFMTLQDMSFNLSFYLGSQWDIAYYPTNYNIVLGVNIVAFALFLYLLKQTKTV